MHATGPFAPIRLGSAFGITLVATLAGVYLVSQILRNSIGVIAPDLAAEAGLSASELGLLSSAFFMAFAAAQMPLGIALDRFGPKPCMLVCGVVLVVGGVAFALATTPAGLIAARVLIGFGSSCYLMAPLTFYAHHFPPARFPMLAGLQFGIGTIGTLIATAPLAASSAMIGWRATFVGIAVAAALAGVVVWLVVPATRPDAVGAVRETPGEALAGILTAFRLPGVARLFVMHFMTYASFVLIVGLWGGPYLAHAYGYGLIARGDFLFLAAAGQTVGLLLTGPLERLVGSIKTLVVAGAGLTAALLLVLAACGTLPPIALAIWLTAFGLASAYSPLLVSHGRMAFPPALLGRGITLLNMGTMLGVFVSQAASGALIDLFGTTDGAYPLAAYRAIFVAQAIGILLALLPYLGIKAPNPA